MSGLWGAVRLLTILPLPRGWGESAADRERSVACFPLVGLLAGALLGGLAWALARVLPPLPAAGVTVVLMAALSGGLHLDGLADMADGFLSSRPRERVLEIMKDSRIGVMGAAALWAVLFVKAVSLAALGADARAGAVLLCVITGRCALGLLMHALPYVRADGLATDFYKGRSAAAVILSLALPALAACAWLGWRGLIPLAAAAAGVAWLAWRSRRRIGGATGDVLGAGCELAETLVALALAAL